MTTLRPCVLFVAVTALAAGSALTAADRATEKAIEELILQITAGLKTDGEKAVKLYESGHLLTDDPTTQTALLAKAVEYGSKDVSGRPVRAAVLAAIDILTKKDPQRRAEWLRKKLDVLRAAARTGATAADRQEAGGQLLEMLTQHARGAESAKQWDKAVEYWQEAAGVARRFRLEGVQELHSRGEWARHFDTASRQAGELAEKVKAASDDTKTRMALLQTYVADLDDPRSAGRYLAADVEAAWRTRVPQAANAIQSLAAPACRQLGQWYAGPVLKDCRTDFARILVLQRARKYYNRILDDKTAPQAAERKAVLGDLAAVEVQLQKLGVSIAQPATIHISCDNEYDLYVNGRRIGSGRDWRNLEKYEVRLTPGDVIAVRGWDDGAGRTAGLFCCVVMRDRTLPSAKDWRYTLRPPANWMTSGYGRNDRPVSVTNIAPDHKGRKFAGTSGVYMWASETAGTVYFKLIVPP